MSRKRSSFSSNIILHYLAIPLFVVAPTDGGARNHTPKSGGIVCRRRHSAACCLTSCSHVSCWFPTRRPLLLTGLISHSLGTLFPDYSPPISEKVDMLHSCKANELVWTPQNGTHDKLDNPRSSPLCVYQLLVGVSVLTLPSIQQIQRLVYRSNFGLYVL